MRQRFLGILVIIVTLAVSGLMGSVAQRARAAINTGETLGGTIGNGNHTAPHPGTYGPVDQSAPLNFTTQPAGVPHTYVGGQLYNVQVLKGFTYPQVLNEMANFTTALGVGCEYCHNVTNYAYDTPTKKIARTMIVMANGLNRDWVAPVHKDFPNFAVNGDVGCVTCHRGSPVHDVEWNIVPVQYLDWPAKTTRQAGFVVNSMYSVANSLGVNCLFCHNSADFVSLQYYPTNQIAHRMWHMVDEINHKYLPPNVKAVTCYTCHQGAKWPSKLVVGPLDQTPVDATAVHPEVHENPGAFLSAGVK
jgi:hypothetical protein